MWRVEVQLDSMESHCSRFVKENTFPLSLTWIETLLLYN
jgi:hypothetical protein